jgi:threonine aldolase
VALHLDGARLWECRPFYGRDYAQIAGLFDSVYVSFYKTLGGIAGAALAGPADVIAEARVWQRRQGGNLVRLFPCWSETKGGHSVCISALYVDVARRLHR